MLHKDRKLPKATLSRSRKYRIELENNQRVVFQMSLKSRSDFAVQRWRVFFMWRQTEWDKIYENQSKLSNYLVLQWYFGQIIGNFICMNQEKCLKLKQFALLCHSLSLTLTFQCCRILSVTRQNRLSTTLCSTYVYIATRRFKYFECKNLLQTRNHVDYFSKFEAYFQTRNIWFFVYSE